MNNVEFIQILDDAVDGKITALACADAIKAHKLEHGSKYTIAFIRHFPRFKALVNLIAPIVSKDLP